MLTLAVAAPDAAWRLSGDSANASSNLGDGIALKPGTCARSAKPVANPLSANILLRQRDHQHRKIELQLLERRYAQLKQARHSKVRRRRHMIYPFIQYQRWLATLSIDAEASGFALSDVTSNDVSMSSIGWSNGTSLGATASTAANGDFSWTGTSLLFNDGKGALQLSGGSITDTSKVTLDADGGLELYLTPSWSFIANVDGEVRPQPQLSAGTGTLHHTW